MERDILMKLSKEKLVDIILGVCPLIWYEPSGTTKFEQLPVVLQYEIARYSPRVLPILVSINRFMETKMSRDACYIQTLIEEIYTDKKVREFTFKECLVRLRGGLRNKTHVTHFDSHWNGISIYDINTTKSLHNMVDYCDIAVVGDTSPYYVNWITITATQVFYCGHYQSSTNSSTRLAMTYDISTNLLTREPDMLYPRNNQGLALYDWKVYAIAGYLTQKWEVFDLETRKWTDIPDIPQLICYITSDAMKGQVFNLEWNTGGNLFIYNIINESWKIVQVDEFEGSAVISFEETLYLITDQQIHEVDPVTHEIKSTQPITNPCQYTYLKDFAHVDRNTITFLNDDGYVMQFEIPKKNTTHTVNLNLLTHLIT